MIAVTERAVKEVRRIIEEQNLPEWHRPARRRQGRWLLGILATRSVSTTRSATSTRSTSIEGIQVACDPKSFLYLSGTEVDFEESLMGRGFKLRQPERRRRPAAAARASASDRPLRPRAEPAHDRDRLPELWNAALSTRPRVWGVQRFVRGRHPERSPFEVLGVERAATLDAKDLRSRLLRFSRIVHPDFYGADDQLRERAEANTARLNEAYGILSDDFARVDWLVAGPR